MEVCKTDMQKIIKYLDDAARMYDNHPGQRNVCRAWVIRQLIKKLNKKLVVTSKCHPFCFELSFCLRIQII